MHRNRIASPNSWLACPLSGMMLVAGSLLVAPPASAANDSWLVVKTKLALATAPNLGNARVLVDVTNGNVGLFGKVATEQDRTAAELLVRALDGVTEVDNRLVAAGTPAPAPAEVDDAAVQKEATGALRGDGALAGSRLRVKAVRRGVVVLGGRAEALTEALRAVTDVWSVAGVRHVVLQTVEPAKLETDHAARRHGLAKTAGEAPSAKGSTVDADLEAAQTVKLLLMTDSQSPSEGVFVDVSQGTATLFGSVPTPLAKTAIEVLARTVAGISDVHNGLDVLPPASEAEAVADDQIKHEVVAALRGRHELRGVRADVRDGLVLLRGTVAGMAERLQAVTIARHAPGVRCVKDDLRMSGARQRPSPATPARKGGIRPAGLRRPISL
jgi:osmotically-inducible protein OsmY